jgi:RNA polymerase sigma factor (sigma-70 family)
MPMIDVAVGQTESRMQPVSVVAQSDRGGARNLRRQHASARPDDWPLLGRDDELDTVRALVDGLTVNGRVLIVRGRPGMGKSSIVRWTEEYAAQNGLVALRSMGVQAEAQMPFAGLHQLLRPVLDRSRVLPVAQRNALASAFGAADGQPDLFLTALATLNVLGELASSAHILLVAEDVHWLDAATCEVLAFLGRRLRADPILLIATVRDGYPTALDDVGASEMELEGLDEDSARRLIDLRAPRLNAAVRERVLGEAQGNPLALIELPLAWGPHAGHVEIDRLPLPARLEQAFADRVATLPKTTQTLLLLAALNDSPSIAEMLRAGERLCDPKPETADLVPAQNARLIAFDEDGVEFSHPLVRSAICQAAGVAERARAHAALAHELSHDLDRCVWHRAAASFGEDDEIARELDCAAARAKRRGGLSIAAAALKRAAMLSQDAAARGARQIRAAELEHELGRTDRASELLRSVDASRLSEAQHGRLVWLREFMRETSGTATIAESIALAARMQAAGDTELALDAILTSALKAFWFNAREDAREAIIAVAESLPVGDHEPKLLAVLSLADPVHRGGLVIGSLTRLGPGAFLDPEDLRMLGIALVVIPEYDLAGRFLAAAVDGLRDQGRLTVLARALGSQAHAALFRGDFALTEQAAEEGVRLTRETRQPRWECSCQTFLGHVSAVQGDAERAGAQITLAEQLLTPPRSTPALQHFQLARGTASLTAGQPDIAFEHISRVFHPADPAYNPLIGTPGLIDLADAAVATDQVITATRIVETLGHSVHEIGATCQQTKVRYARAVLADVADAEDLYEEALRALGPDSRWEHARLRLAYGSWLRRRRRITDARRSLRISRDEFTAIGAQPWSDRAEQELRATGERSRRRVLETRDELSAQELHIARLAAEGLTNREIGKRLFLSHRTVGSHLYRIFPKLGITSRAELARTVLADATPQRSGTG